MHRHTISSDATGGNGAAGSGGGGGGGIISHANRALEKLGRGRNLDGPEISSIMLAMLEGKTDDAYNAAFLKGLSAKGETDGELLAMLDVMMQKSVPVDTSGIEGPVIDVCGTGGDMQQTFNISTAASFIVAAASEIADTDRCLVAKHGNRSTSGVSGSADIFEMIGYDVNAGPPRMREILEQERVCFIFAQRFHPAMRHVAAARRSLGIRTAFNVLGPLANPARVTRQLVGVSSKDLLYRIPKMLLRAGRCQMAMTVTSADGMDELSTSSSNMAVVADGEHGSNRMTEMIIKPEDVGLHRSESVSGIRVADAGQSARYVTGAIDGTATRQIVETAVFNAAGALMISGTAGHGRDGNDIGMDYAVQTCMEAVRGGLASKRLDSFVKRAGDPALLEGIRHGT